MAKKKHSSIVMATYNGEKYLSEQLESFCKQSVLPDELVVSDDNSKDATKEIILNFAKTAPFKVLFVENNHNSGVVKNFENALKHANGDIIFFSDQDDYWLSNKIEKYMSVFEDNKEIAYIFSDLKVADENLNDLGKSLYSPKTAELAHNYEKTPLAAFKDIISVKVFVNGATSAFRREFLSLICPVPVTTMLHDGWTAALISAVAKVKFLSEKYSLYRQHRDNVIGYRGYSFLRRLKNAAKENKQRKIDELNCLRLLLKRLNESNITHKQESTSFLMNKIEILERHIKLYETNKASRAFSLIYDLTAGNYNVYFQKMKSFCTDLAAMLTN